MRVDKHRSHPVSRIQPFETDRHSVDCRAWHVPYLQYLGVERSGVGTVSQPYRPEGVGRCFSYIQKGTVLLVLRELCTSGEWSSNGFGRRV